MGVTNLKEGYKKMRELEYCRTWADNKKNVVSLDYKLESQFKLKFCIGVGIFRVLNG